MPITFVEQAANMFYLVYGFLYLVSLLPIWILYGIGDGIRWIVFNLFGYRKSVIYKNLAIAFPEKSRSGRQQIARKFEQNFMDTFVETLKLFSASQSFIKKRIQGDFDLINQLYAKGLKCQIHTGHNFNWEMANLGFSLFSPYTLLGVYMPLNNKTMDRVFRKMRSRSGTVLLPATSMRKSMLPYRGTQYILGLVADQVPANAEKSWWLNFFGVPSPFVPGPEKGARAGNIPVVFVHITKTKRGHYYIHSRLASESPSELPEGELTRAYRNFLEEVIHANPEMWLWSHRRWKKSWQPAYQSQWIDNGPAPETVVHPYDSVTI